MKANHNTAELIGNTIKVVVNISSSKNESKSQQSQNAAVNSLSCCKYQ